MLMAIFLKLPMYLFLGFCGKELVASIIVIKNNLPSDGH